MDVCIEVLDIILFPNIPSTGAVLHRSPIARLRQNRKPMHSDARAERFYRSAGWQVTGTDDGNLVFDRLAIAGRVDVDEVRSVSVAPLFGCGENEHAHAAGWRRPLPM
jgi:hypothetical protein